MQKTFAYLTFCFDPERTYRHKNDPKTKSTSAMLFTIYKDKPVLQADDWINPSSCWRRSLRFHFDPRLVMFHRLYAISPY